MISRLASIALILVPLALFGGCESPKKPVSTAPKLKTRETVGKTTFIVLKLSDALAKGGVLADMTVPISDPLTQDAAVYRTTVAKISAGNVKHTIDLRNASNIQDPKPLSYEELMAEIIKKDQPDGLPLSMLPYYQEYAWDEAGQKLVVVEFPKRKEDLKKQEKEERGY
jgi:hypothetical protein